jgi:hypothetical protein
VQIESGAPSSEHQKEPGSSAENSKIALVDVVVAGGPESMDVSGAVSSMTVHA